MQLYIITNAYNFPPDYVACSSQDAAVIALNLNEDERIDRAIGPCNPQFVEEEAQTTLAYLNPQHIALDQEPVWNPYIDE